MKNRNLVRRVGIGVIALAAGLGLAGPASAAPPMLPAIPSLPAPSGIVGSVDARPDSGLPWVVFGDSFAANPTIPASSPFAGYDPGAGERMPVAGRTPGCAQDLNNWPRVAARATGVGDPGLADYSCNGEGRVPVATLYSHVNAAIANGDLGPRTNKVFLQYGALNILQWSETLSNPGGVERIAGLFTQEIRGVVDRVRKAAPNAELVFVGYPEFLDHDRACPVDIGRGGPVSVMVPGAGALENAVRDTQARVAGNLGMRFIDMKAMSGGHSMCAAPDQRWVSGFFDTTSHHNMKVHPTIEGSRAMGDIVAGRMR